MYFAQILPNTDLADPEYQREFGIESRLIELNEIHGSVRGSGLVTEYEEIIVGVLAIFLGSDDTPRKRGCCYNGRSG